MAGSVTPTERVKAVAQDADKAKLLQRGIAVATQFGFRAQQAAITTLRRGGKPEDVIRAVRGKLAEAKPLLTDAMIHGHLVGMKRSAAVAGIKRKPLALKATPLTSTVYKTAVDVLVRRFLLASDQMDELAAVYGIMAGRVLQSASDALESRLRTALLRSTKLGEATRDGVKRLAGAFAKSGVTPDNSFTLEAIFRTQTTTAYNAGRWQANQDPDIQDILWGYKYVTVGDDRVRIEHAAWEGEQLKKSDPWWKSHWPPNGWACRCTCIEIFDEGETIRPPKSIRVGGQTMTPQVDPGFEFNPGEAFVLGASA